MYPDIRYNSTTGVAETSFITMLNRTGRFVLTNINLNNWTHFCAVIQHGVPMLLYVNGTPYTSTTGATTVTANLTYTGAGINPYDNSSPNALVTEIRIYQTALTTNQVQSIYTWNGADGTQPF